MESENKRIGLVIPRFSGKSRIFGVFEGTATLGERKIAARGCCGWG